MSEQLLFQFYMYVISFTAKKAMHFVNENE